MDDADDAGFSKRLKEEHDALEKYRDEQMKKLREQMQQELLQHQEALAMQGSSMRWLCRQSRKSTNTR